MFLCISGPLMTSQLMTVLKHSSVVGGTHGAIISISYIFHSVTILLLFVFIYLFCCSNLYVVKQALYKQVSLQKPWQST